MTIIFCLGLMFSGHICINMHFTSLFTLILIQYKKIMLGVVKNSIYFDLPARDVFTLFVMLYFLYWLCIPHYICFPNVWCNHPLLCAISYSLGGGDSSSLSHTQSLSPASLVGQLPQQKRHSFTAMQETSTNVLQHNRR